MHALYIYTLVAHNIIMHYYYIYTTEEVTLRFKALEYTTTESLGYAEVCIEIKGQRKRAPRNFNLTISTQTGSAGDN